MTSFPRIFLALATASTIAASPHPLQARQASSSGTCYYDQFPSCQAQCVDTPDENFCEQSILAVCTYIAFAKPNGTTLQARYSTGENQDTPVSAQSLKGDCLAYVNLGAGVTKAPSLSTCTRAFASISETCGNEGRAGYKKECGGGMINVDPCTGEVEDEAAPVYGLGAPAEIGLIPPHLPGAREGGAEVLYFDEDGIVVDHPEYGGLKNTSFNPFS